MVTGCSSNIIRIQEQKVEAGPKWISNLNWMKMQEI